MRTSGASNVLRERAEQANYEAFPSLASGIDGLKEWETNLDKIVSGVKRDSSDHSASTYNSRFQFFNNKRTSANTDTGATDLAPREDSLIKAWKTVSEIDALLGTDFRPSMPTCAEEDGQGQGLARRESGSAASGVGLRLSRGSSHVDDSYVKRLNSELEAALTVSLTVKERLRDSMRGASGRALGLGRGPGLGAGQGQGTGAGPSGGASAASRTPRSSNDSSSSDDSAAELAAAGLAGAAAALAAASLAHRTKGKGSPADTSKASSSRLSTSRHLDSPSVHSRGSQSPSLSPVNGHSPSQDHSLTVERRRSNSTTSATSGYHSHTDTHTHGHANGSLARTSPSHAPHAAVQANGSSPTSPSLAARSAPLASASAAAAPPTGATHAAATAITTSGAEGSAAAGEAGRGAAGAGVVLRRSSGGGILLGGGGTGVGAGAREGVGGGGGGGGGSVLASLRERLRSGAAAGGGRTESPQSHIGTASQLSNAAAQGGSATAGSTVAATTSSSSSSATRGSGLGLGGAAGSAPAGVGAARPPSPGLAAGLLLQVPGSPTVHPPPHHHHHPSRPHSHLHASATAHTLHPTTPTSPRQPPAHSHTHLGHSLSPAAPSPRTPHTSQPSQSLLASPRIALAAGPTPTSHTAPTSHAAAHTHVSMLSSLSATVAASHQYSSSTTATTTTSTRTAPHSTTNAPTPAHPSTAAAAPTQTPTLPAHATAAHPASPRTTAAPGPGLAPGHRPEPGPGGHPRARGPPLVQVAVGSALDHGVWDSEGRWRHADPVAEVHVPQHLQRISPDDLVKVRELGRGCFGSVWLARWRGVEVALKELLDQGATDCAPAEVFSEAERLASLRHPCVIAFYGIVATPGCYATVVEYMRMGSLKSGLTRLRKQGVEVSRRLRVLMALQAARGMEYLHGQYVVHFDLKCDNLLCDLRDPQRPVIKIADLGLSKKKKDSFVSGNMRGTLPWMAPELFPGVRKRQQQQQQQQVQGAAGGGAGGGAGGPAAKGEHAVGAAGEPPELPEDRVNEKVDVFSFGIVMYEIWQLGEQPYTDMGLADIFAGVMTGSLRPRVPPDCDPEWAALMQACWHAIPRQRPSFSEVAERLDALATHLAASEGDGAGIVSSSSAASRGATGVTAPAAMAVAAASLGTPRALG